MEERIKNMTFKDILDVMIKGLEKRWVNIDMDTFGEVDLNGICYGCAATNALCQIVERSITPEYIQRGSRHHYFQIPLQCLNDFENAVNCLRQGLLITYNFNCAKSDFLRKAVSEKTDYNLPCLYDNFTEEELNEYRKLRDSL